MLPEIRREAQNWDAPLSDVVVEPASKYCNVNENRIYKYNISYRYNMDSLADMVIFIDGDKVNVEGYKYDVLIDVLSRYFESADMSDEERWGCLQEVSSIAQDWLSVMSDIPPGFDSTLTLDSLDVDN